MKANYDKSYCQLATTLQLLGLLIIAIVTGCMFNIANLAIYGATLNKYDKIVTNSSSQLVANQLAN